MNAGKYAVGDCVGYVLDGHIYAVGLIESVSPSGTIVIVWCEKGETTDKTTLFSVMSMNKHFLRIPQGVYVQDKLGRYVLKKEIAMKVCK